VWRYVYRAIDQHGQVIDVLLTVHRDAAARQFFTRALRTLGLLRSRMPKRYAACGPGVSRPRGRMPSMPPGPMMSSIHGRTSDRDAETAPLMSTCPRLIPAASR
jgi:hypothetical protein